jgi:hypothetical protein
LTKIRPRGSKELVKFSLASMQYLDLKPYKIRLLADLIYSGIQITDVVSIERYSNAYRFFENGSRSMSSHYSKFSKAWMLEQGLGVEKSPELALEAYDRLLSDIWNSSEPVAAFVPTLFAKLSLKLKILMGYQ